MYVFIHPQNTSAILSRCPSVNHADLTIIFVQVHNVSALLSLSPKLPTLKTIVAIGEVSAAPKDLLDAWSKQRGIRVITLAERKCLLSSSVIDTHRVDPVEETGAKSPIKPPTVTSETVATICYTSVRHLFDICEPR